MQQAASTKEPISPHISLPKGKAKWAMILLLYAANVNVSFMQSSMNVALDTIASSFHLTLSIANWVVLGYAIIVATVITMTATILKRFGYRKVMLISLIFAFAGSFLGFFAPNFPLLLAARLLQAVATGITFPLVNDALLRLAPDGKAGLLLSIDSGIIGFGLAIAPPLSGLLITYVSLKSIFLLSAVVSLLLFVLGLFALHDLQARIHKNIDVLSVILSLAALGTFMYGLNEVSHQLLVSLVLMAIAVILTAVFIRRQKKLTDPLLDLSAFKVKAFSLGETLMGLGYLGSLYLSLLTPLFLEGASGLTPFMAGCMLALPIACYAIFCFVSGSIVGKHGVWPLVPIGFACTLAAYCCLYFASSKDMLLPFLICVAASYGGIGLLYPAIKSADLEVLPSAIEPAGSSIHSTLVQIAGSISSALFVGMISTETTTLMAQGMDKAQAYATGFSHTLLIAIGLFVVAFIISFPYAKLIVKDKGTHV